MEVAVALAVLVLGLVTWNAVAWPRLRPATGGDASGTIAILIPARDEREHIAACLDAASRQRANVTSVLVYDDHSTDGTDAIVQAAAERDPRIMLIAPEPLADGWKGKPFACSRLAAAANADWFLFVDADTTLRTDVAAAMISAATRHRATLISFWPAIELGGLAERLLMPLLNFVVFSLYPAPIAQRLGLPSLGLAHGACMLFDARTYRRLGGHALVAAELFEDTALAREWRRHGERSLCVDGQDAVRVRMYRSFGEMWAGFLKNLHPAFKTKLGFWSFIVFHFAVFVLPLPWLIVALLTDAPFGAAVAALAAGASARLVQCARFGYPAWSALLHPLAEAVLVALGLASWWAMRSGRGVVWKGRRYGVG